MKTVSLVWTFRQYNIHPVYYISELCTNGFLTGFNVKEVFSVSNSLDACIVLCQEEREFRCASVDYDTGDGRCWLSKESRLTQPDAYTQDAWWKHCILGEVLEFYYQFQYILIVIFIKLNGSLGIFIGISNIFQHVDLKNPS